MDLNLGWLLDLLDRSLDPNTDRSTRNEVDSKLAVGLLSQQPVQYLNSLTAIAVHPDYPLKFRLHALVLLRTIPIDSSTSTSAWRTSLTADQQHQILNQLFAALLSPSTPQAGDGRPPELIQQLSHTIADLGKHCPEATFQPDNQWSMALRPTLLANLLPHLQEPRQLPNPILQTALLNIFVALPSLFSSSPTELESIVLTSLGSDHFPLRLAALQTICVPTLDLETSFTNAVHQSVLLPLLGNIDESELETALTHLIEFVTFNDTPDLPPWLDPLLQLALNQHQPISVRSSALECLTTLIECRPPAPNEPRLVWLEPIFRGLLTLMAEIDEDPHWSLKLDDNDEDQDAIFIQAEQALDRLTQEVTKTHSDQLFELILNSAQQPPSTSWQARHAFLSALAVTGEGLAESFSLATEHIYHVLQAGFEDHHPRVIYAAIYAIAQLSSPLKITFSTKPVHQQVLSWLLQCLENSSQPRIQAFAAKALINVLWDDGFRKEEIADQMIGPILMRLISLCESHYTDQRTLSNKIRLDALNAIGKLFGSMSRQGALTFYDTTASILRNLLREVDLARKTLASDGTELDDEEIDETELKVFEAVSQLAKASGEERFDSDASWWANQMVTALESRPQEQTRIASCLARLSGGMKPDRFVSEGFLAVALDRSLKVCRSKPDISISALLDKDHAFDDCQWESVLIGDQTFGIKAAELADKELSLKTIILLTNQIGVWLMPHCDQIVEAVVPLLKFYFSDEVRESAMTLLPLLIQSAKLSGMLPEQLRAISTSFCNSITHAFNVEPLDASNLADSFLIAWAECVANQPPSDEEVIKMVEACCGRIGRVIDDSSGQDDQDDEEYEESLRRLFTGISRVLRTAIGLQPDWMWTKFKDQVVDWVQVNSSYTLSIQLGLKRLGFRLVGAFVKYSACAPVGGELIQKVGQNILNGFNDQDECIRGLAPFIVGLCAETNGETHGLVYVELIKSSIEFLLAGLSRKSLLASKNVEAIQVARENCISALAKIIRSPEGVVIDTDRILPQWIDALPIEIDVEEVDPSYGLLLELIARGHESVDPTKNGMERIEQVVKSLLSAICNPSISIESRNSLSVALRAYLTELPSQIVDHKNLMVLQHQNQPHDYQSSESVWIKLEEFLSSSASQCTQ